jgi:hypothetical protein
VVQQVPEGDWGIVPPEYLMDETARATIQNILTVQNVIDS